MNYRQSLRGGLAMARSDYLVLFAFVLVVLFGGSNAVAVRFSNLGLPPFWGAAVRFGTAALIFWSIVLLRRISLPRGQALLGATLYGLLSVGASYAFLYWGLLQVQAVLSMVVLAFVPLITLLLALVHGLESFRPRVLVGALLGIVGILLAVGGALGSAMPVSSFLALVAGAVCLSEGAIVFKLFPKGDLVATNALALTTGAALLLVLSFIVGELRPLPTTATTWLALIYLVLFGTVALFYLYLFVLSHWDASATAYSFLLFPVATVVIAAWLAGEVVTPTFVIGGAIVLVGVWLGGFGA
jgi:drug/metabolite transporter (DMT)-like permease